MTRPSPLPSPLLLPERPVNWHWWRIAGLPRLVVVVEQTNAN